MFKTYVGVKVHSGGVKPDKKRFPSFMASINEVNCSCIKFLINSFHPFFIQGACIFYFSVCIAVDNSARTKLFPKIRIFGINIIWVKNKLVNLLLFELDSLRKYIAKNPGISWILSVAFYVDRDHTSVQDALEDRGQDLRQALMVLVKNHGHDHVNF